MLIPYIGRHLFYTAFSLIFVLKKPSIKIEILISRWLRKGSLFFIV